MDVRQILQRANPNLRVGRVRLEGDSPQYDEYTSHEDITPLKAMEWLVATWQRYPNGRNFYPTRLEKIVRYAEEMRQGEWEYREDSDPIVLTDGMVTGGRHRLHAILLSGQTIHSNVKIKELKDGNDSRV